MEASGPLGGDVRLVICIMGWIVLSSITILFNKYLLSTLDFHFPAILTCWHMLFATLMTQLLARFTTLLDDRKTVKMTGKVYLRAIVPIGVLYSSSLVCSNQVYLYLSVAFIQMLKASAPAAVLFTSWMFGVATPSMTVLLNVMAIVAGVAIASIGEVKFVWIGFFYQAGGIFSEAVRLILIQILLSPDGQKMDPLVSLYYYAPVCTFMNFLVAALMEFSSFHVADVWRVGVSVLLLNAGVAFLLNVASVFLIGRTSGLVMTLVGVLKNILLVISSVIIFGTIINGLQVLGYGIALAGLIYYGVGYDGIKTYATVTKSYATKLWESQPDSPAAFRSTLIKRILLIGTFVVVVGFLVRGIAHQGSTAQGLTQELTGKSNPS